MISAGHAWVDVQDYTLPQIEAFLDAINTADRGKARLALLVARGAKATEKAFRKMLQEFS